MTQPTDSPTQPTQTAQRWRCPLADYNWTRSFPADPVPECPTHHVDLVRDADIVVTGAS
jgi:hypothetical protein